MKIVARAILCALALLPAARAPGGDWTMFGGDAQRTGWARDEKILNKKNVGQLGLKWKVHLKNEPKSLTSLTAPIVVSGVPTESGPKDIVYVAGSGDLFYALDAATGRILWEKEFRTDVTSKRPGMWLCPKGVNATPAVDVGRKVVYAVATDGKLYALDLASGQEKFRAPQFVPPFAKAWSLNLRGSTVYTSLSQNCGDTPSGVAAIDLADPVNYSIRVWRAARYAAGVWGRGGALIGRDGWIYGATGDGMFDPAENDFGQTMFALHPETLKLADYFTPANWDYVRKRDFDIGTTPVAFVYRNQELLAVGGKEGVVYLMAGARPDETVMGGGDHHHNVYTTPLLANDEEWFEARGVWGGLSFYRDEENRHWVYVPLWGPLSERAPGFPITNGPNPNGSIAAFTVEDHWETGKPYLKPAWISGDFSVPEPVVIANGVVFALSNGENVRQTVNAGPFDRETFKAGDLLSDNQRAENKAKAELRALDAQTGKVLYDSGPDAFETWAHFSGIAVANGQIYAVDFASNLYCFALRP